MTPSNSLLKFLTIAICCLASITGMAQKMAIVYPGQLYSTYTFTEPEKTRVKEQVSSYEFEKIVKYSHESNWPSGISTLSAWSSNKENMKKYVVYKVATFSDKIIVVAPAAENKLMPYNLIPSTDIYFIMSTTAVQEVGESTPKTPNKVSGTAVIIKATGGMYSDFDIAGSTFNSSIRSQVGDEYEEVAKYSNDDYWPTAISTFDGREKVRSKMNDYKAYKIASFDNKYILRIPASENSHMPYDMRPTRDIYWVIEQKDIELKGANTTNTYSSKKFTNGTAAKIKSTGGMYSSFDIAGSTFNASIRSQLGDEYNDVVIYSKETGWPSGIATFEKREKIREQLNNYKAYMIASFDDKYILRIPSAENQSMPYDMRPARDIYFVINQKDIELKGTGNTNSNNNSGKKTPGVKVKIKSTGGMYSDFDIEGDAAATSLKWQLGDEYNDVVMYGKDDNWPSAISTFSGREGVRQKMNDYVAYKIAEFGEKCILRIPKDENQFMPYDMRPTRDIYWVINKSDISVTTGNDDYDYEEDIINGSPSDPSKPKPIGGN